MFKFIREKFQLWIYDQYSRGRDLADEKCGLHPVMDESEFGSIHCRGTRFEVHYAHGGLVIELDRMDEPNSLYIITEDQNLGQALSKIITVDRMSQK